MITALLVLAQRYLEGVKLGNNVRIGANAIVNKDVPSNNTAFGNPMQTHMNKRGIITIATPSVEEEFLNKYPQYRELIKTI